MSEYSGKIANGWNPTGTYDRLQFQGEMPPEQIAEFLHDEALPRFNKSGNTRLDLRIKPDSPITQFVLPPQQDLEISAIRDPRLAIIKEITLCLNKPVRQVQDKERIVKSIDTSIAKGLDAKIQMPPEDLFFVNTGFSAAELENLWSNTFGWDIDSCQVLIDSIEKSRTADRVYGIRCENGELIAALLLSQQSNGIAETTEWAVDQKRRRKGLITPLLIYSNLMWTNANPNDSVYAHLRVGRSTTPALRAGMRLFYGKQSNILTNHVTVSADEPRDEWNPKLDLGLPNPESLRSFVTGQFDPRSINDTIRQVYLK